MTANNDDYTLWPKRKTLFDYDDDLIKDELINNIVEKSSREFMESEIFKKQWLGNWETTGIGTSAIGTSTTTNTSRLLELQEKVQRLEREKQMLERNALRRRVEEQDEELLRVTHPAVKDSWEKYQITLRLAKRG